MQWLDRSEYPFQERYFHINGHKLHYIEEGNGPVLLFIHGTPSWSFDFRRVIKSLSRDFRCIAVDHIGFGLSDKPEFYDYTVQNHSLTLEAFMNHLTLQDVILVVHDFGGPIGFRVAIDNPERIRAFVVLNSWLWSSEDDTNFKKMKRILRSPLVPFLYLNLNFSARFIMPSSFGLNKMKRRIHRQFIMPFSGRGSRYGTLAFARSLLTDQPWFESLWNKTDVISQKPTLLVWGMRDKFITPDYLAKFQKRFVNHQVLRLMDSGHFPQEEEPKTVAIAIRNFCTSLIENDRTISINEDSVVKHKF